MKTPILDIYNKFAYDFKSLESERQIKIEKGLSDYLGQNTDLWWFDEPLTPVPNHCPRLLIGIATWSKYDFEFLDNLLRCKIPEDLWIDIFSTSSCKKQKDFDQYIPDIEEVFQTPVVGYWEYGNIKESATGAKGRELVYRILTKN